VLFLLDEDIDVAVGAYLAAGGHEVRYARQLFGPQTKDTNNAAYARSQDAILVTGDKALASSIRQKHTAACLHLLDLGTQQLDRVGMLLPIVESEAAIAGPNFWMLIKKTNYTVER
jgi:predicted nuclease of predicted toxin-antitoxin system